MVLPRNGCLIAATCLPYLDNDTYLLLPHLLPAATNTTYLT